MVYENRRIAVSKAIKELLKKQTTFTKEEKERMASLIQIEYGASSTLTNELINAFIKTEQMKIEG